MATLNSIKQELESKVAKVPATLPTSASERLDRFQDRQKTLERVIDGLQQSVIAELHTVTETMGPNHRYFMYQSYYDRVRANKFHKLSADIKNPQRGLDVVVNDSGAIKQTTLAGFELNVVTEPRDTIRWLTNYRESRQDQFLTDWDGEFIKLIAELRKRPQLDAKIKEMLIQHLVVGACDGSRRLSTSLTPELSKLKALSKAQETWFEPTAMNDILDPEVDQLIIPRLVTLYQSRVLPQSEVAIIRKLRLTWLGLLIRSNDGKPILKLTDTPNGNGSLWVIREAATKTDAVEWIRIGEFASGQVLLNGSSTDMVAGRPVFLMLK